MDEIDTNKIKGLTKIGLFDQCPYCLKKLDKIPGRKKKCDFCNKFIYVRTRPIDRKRVLVTEKQADDIENQWTIYHQYKLMHPPMKKCPVCGSEMHIQQNICYICMRDDNFKKARNSIIDYCLERPDYIKGIKWNLSKFEESCERCKELAREDKYGLGPGLFPVDKLPGLPHHGCNCFFTPEIKDEYIKQK